MAAYKIRYIKWIKAYNDKMCRKCTARSSTMNISINMDRM